MSTDLGGSSDREIMARLHGALVGRAREVVENIMIGDCGAKEVIDLLAIRFGNPELMVERIARGLRKLPKLDSPGTDIVDFATKLKGGVAAIQSMGHLGYLHSPELARDILMKLPAALKYEFDKYFGKAPASEPRLVTLSKFIYERAEMSHRAGTNDMRESRNVPSTSGSRGNNARAVYTTVAVASPEPVRGRDEAGLGRASPCGYCGRTNHRISGCRDFARLAIADRWTWARDEGSCYSCLLGGHRLESCPERRVCDVGGCRRLHHPKLHEEREAALARGGSGGRGRGSLRGGPRVGRARQASNSRRRDRQGAVARRDQEGGTGDSTRDAGNTRDAS